MFGIPQMIRTITGTVTSLLTSSTKATDALATMADTWSDSIKATQANRTVAAIREKSEEIYDLTVKVEEKLQKHGDNAILQADLACKDYYISNNKPVPDYLEKRIQLLQSK